MTEWLVFGTIPRDAKLVRDLVNVIKVVAEAMIVSIVGGMVGEVEAGEVATKWANPECTYDV